MFNIEEVQKIYWRRINLAYSRLRAQVASRDPPKIELPKCEPLRKKYDVNMVRSSPLQFIEDNKANDIQYTKERKEYKACLVYLLLKEGTTYWRDYVNELYYNLKDVWDYYNYKHDYPVIIFYDESVTKADIRMLQNARKDQLLVFKNITNVKEEIYEQYIPDPSAYVRCKLNDTNYSIHNMNYVFMNFWRIKGKQI